MRTDVVFSLSDVGRDEHLDLRPKHGWKRKESFLSPITSENQNRPSFGETYTLTLGTSREEEDWG